MSQAGNQRSQKTVFRLSGFRGRLVSVIVTLGFLCIVLNAVLFYAYVLESYGFILRHSTLGPELAEERYGELYGIALALGLLSVAMVAVVAVWTLFITHRVAGPIYHLEKVIEQIRAGNEDQRLNLRRKDEFQEMARAFNQLVDELQQKRSGDPPA